MRQKRENGVFEGMQRKHPGRRRFDLFDNTMNNSVKSGLHQRYRGTIHIPDKIEKKSLYMYAFPWNLVSKHYAPKQLQFLC